jgi:hypothetical protein
VFPSKGSAVVWFNFVIYGFTNVASMVELPPAVTVIVRCQGLSSSFSSFIITGRSNHVGFLRFNFNTPRMM